MRITSRKAVAGAAGIALAAGLLQAGGFVSAPRVEAAISTGWSQAIASSAITKTDMSETNYEYPIIGNGGLSLLADGRGFTDLKPSTASYLPDLHYEYWWGEAPPTQYAPSTTPQNSTIRSNPLALVDRYIVDGAVVNPTVTAFNQVLDVATGTLTTTLGMNRCGAASGCVAFTSVRRSFVTTAGVLVTTVTDSVPSTFSLQTVPRSGYSGTAASVAQGLTITATRTNELSKALAVVAAGSTSSATDARVNLSAPANTAMTYYIAAAGLETPTPESVAFGKADAARNAGPTAAAAGNSTFWSDFWSSSEVSIPDASLMKDYIRSEYILGATTANYSVPNGCFGPRKEGYNGGPDFEWDQPFEFMAMLNAGQASSTKGYADFVEKTLSEAKALAPSYIYPGGPQTTGAKYPWISTWNGKESQVYGNGVPLDADWLAFTSSNAALLDLLQAQYTADPARLATAKQIVQATTQYVRDNAAPAASAGNQLQSQKFFWQWAPAPLTFQKGAVPDQAALLWGLRQSRDLGVGPSTWPVDALNVYMPTAVDPQRGKTVLKGYDGSSPSIQNTTFPMLYPYFFVNVIDARDSTFWPTYLNGTSNTDINYTFNRGWAAVMAAQAGMGDEALNKLKRLYQETDADGVTNPVKFNSLYYSEYDQGGPASTIEVGAHGTLMLGTQSMLFDGRDASTIRVFPATPSAWDGSTVSFTNLRANGGLAVSADQNASVSHVTVKNNTATAAPRTVLVRLPADAVSATVSGGTLSGITDDRFARITVNVPANSTTSLTVTPVRKGSWQTIENASPQFAYAGSWNTASASTASGGTLEYTNSSTASATVAFTGTAVRVIADRNTDHGQLRLSLDGKVIGDYDSWAAKPRGQEVIAELDGLSPSTHTLKLEGTGIKAAYSSGTTISIDSVQYVSTTQTSSAVSDASLSYSGAWTAPSAADATNGVVHVSSAAGATATATFTGTAVTVRGQKGPAQGIVELSIDGVAVAEVDNYAFTDRSADVISIPGLQSGNHTLSIKVKGTKNPNSSGTAVTVDGLVVRAG
jgi:hypothetical protein